MAKLVLTDREVELIKGLLAHTDLNSQEILSIFSFLERNINHREIGAIRTESKPRYADSPTASKAEIQSLLYKASKIGVEATKLGLLPSTDQKSMILKAIEIMKSAILIYNNNTLVTRSETFIVLGVIAWTYALHCFYRKLDIEPVYLGDDGMPLLTGDGKPRLWELSKCIKHDACPLSNGAKNNLRYLIAIRNEVEHRSCEDINASIQSKLQAAALNFVIFCLEHLGQEYDFSEDLAFTIQLAALKISTVPKGDQTFSAAVTAVNAALEADMSSAEQ